MLDVVKLWDIIQKHTASPSSLLITLYDALTVAMVRNAGPVVKMKLRA